MDGKTGVPQHRFPAQAGTHSRWTPVLAGEREDAIAHQAKLLTVQFLDWVGSRPRTRAEARAAWAGTCPLNCAWEDAVADDLVSLTREGRVVLTAKGRARLEQCR